MKNQRKVPTPPVQNLSIKPYTEKRVPLKAKGTIVKVYPDPRSVESGDYASNYDRIFRKKS